MLGQNGSNGPFNEFDLYAMGLTGYARAAQTAYRLCYNTSEQAQEVCLLPGEPYYEMQKLTEIRLDDLIRELSTRGPEYFEGDGHRIPDIDPSMKNLRTLVAVIKGDDETLTEADRQFLMEFAAELPRVWSDATKGLSTMVVVADPAR